MAYELNGRVLAGQWVIRDNDELDGLYDDEAVARLNAAGLALQAALDELALASGNLPVGGTEDQILKIISGVPAWADDEGGGGVSDWGQLEGDIADQTDLQAELDDKQDADADLAAIAALSTDAWGRSLLTLNGQSAGRTYLGLGTAAVQNSSFFDLNGVAAAVEARAMCVGMWDGVSYKQADGTAMDTDPDRAYLYIGPVANTPPTPPNVDASFWWKT